MSNHALTSDFRRAGFGALAEPWEIPSLAERIVRRFADADPAELLSAYLRGHWARARDAVARHIDGFIASGMAPAEFDARALVEAAARVADLPPRDVLTIVSELAPEAVEDDGAERVERYAEWALTDFRGLRARRVARGNWPSRPASMSSYCPTLSTPLEA